MQFVIHTGKYQNRTMVKIRIAMFKNKSPYRRAASLVDNCTPLYQSINGVLKLIQNTFTKIMLGIVIFDGKMSRLILAFNLNQNQGTPSQIFFEYFRYEPIFLYTISEEINDIKHLSIHQTTSLFIITPLQMSHCTHFIYSNSLL